MALNWGIKCRNFRIRRASVNETAVFRSSWEVFSRKAVLRNFTKFTVKHLCHSLFFNKVAGLRPLTLLKKRLCYRCFPVNFAEFSRILFFIEHLWWLPPDVATVKSQVNGKIFWFGISRNLRLAQNAWSMLFRNFLICGALCHDIFDHRGNLTWGIRSSDNMINKRNKK